MSGESAKRLSPIYPFGFAFLCFALPIYVELTYVYMLGFPDGFVTELDSAEEKLAAGRRRESFALSVWSIYLGIEALHEQVRQRVLYTAVFYLIAIAAAIAIDTYFQAHLMGGGGG